MIIWFFIDSIRWTVERLAGVNTAELGGAVGGTEAMTVGLCRHLAARGHDVTLWATKCELPGLWGRADMHPGLVWRGVEGRDGLRGALLNEPSPDVFVAVRRPQVFSLPEAQGLIMHRVLWAGDVLERSQGHIPFLANVDTVVYVSEWHRKQWESVYPPLASQFYSWVTPVALSETWIIKSPRCSRCENPRRDQEQEHPGICVCGGYLNDTVHERETFIYASQPDRGLVPLLKMWPHIRQALPNATLLVTGYTAELSRLMILADRLIKQVNKDVGGVEPARAADKPCYFRHLAQARLLLYPGAYFEETNGHVCSEAMACGVVPLVSRLGALPETVPETAGILFDGDANSTDYQDRYVSEVVRLAKSSADKEISERQKCGRAHVIPRCTYQHVAELWESRLRDLPIKRLVEC